MATTIYKLEKVKGGVTVITLTLDHILHEEHGELMKSFDQLLNEGHKKIVLDLSMTSYISSLILASFVYMQKKAIELGGKLIFCQIKNRVEEILKVTNLDKVFEIVATKEEALKKFS